MASNRQRHMRIIWIVISILGIVSMIGFSLIPLLYAR